MSGCQCCVETTLRRRMSDMAKKIDLSAARRAQKSSMLKAQLKALSPRGRQKVVPSKKKSELV